MKNSTPNRADKEIEYAVCLNKVPDYIVGVEILTVMIGMMSYWYNQKDSIPKEEMYELIQKIMEEGIYKQLLK